MDKKPYMEMTKDELEAEKVQVEKELAEWKGRGLQLNMARGNPSHEQHRLSRPMFDILTSDSSMVCEDGTDCMNYGSPFGIPEARRMMASMLDLDPKNVYVLGNSSLNIMYEQISRSMIHGLMGHEPMMKQMLEGKKLKWLCPSPGYDRHLKITETFGFEMIPIAMKEDGPDMDRVEELVNTDETVKGIWCVPKFSNPTGVVFSDQVVERFAHLRPAAKDFRIYWDNAYCVHYLTEERPEIIEILSACQKAGNPDIVFEFASTSKITVAGSGISAFAASEANLDDFKTILTTMTIAYNKTNQLCHARYLPDKAAILNHMEKHRAIVGPKFKVVLDRLEADLGTRKIGSWNKPLGGYFVAYQAPCGTAKRITRICQDCGVTMTPAGAQFPYGKDPEDSWIRIAPTFPLVDELSKAMEIFTRAVRLAYIESLMATV